MRLTASVIKSLQLPAGKSEWEFPDERLRAFRLRLRASGAQAWVVRYKIAGHPKKLTLGTPAELEPGKAFELARDIVAQVRMGHDPAAEKRQRKDALAETFGSWLPPYLTFKQEKVRAGSFNLLRHHLEVNAKSLSDYPLKTISRRQLADLLEVLAKRNGPSAANRTQASLSGFFSWCIKRGLLDNNPASHLEKATENESRDRVLSNDELAAIWGASGDDAYGSIIKLLMLLGCRRAEVGGLRWSEIDFDAARLLLPPSRTKNGEEFIIPVPDQALAILKAQPRSDREVVFGRGKGWENWSSPKRELDKRIAAAGTAISDWRLHDFRRAVVTWLGDNGTPPHVGESILGHVQGDRVARTYMRSVYLDERRRALARWADHISSLVGGRPAGKIVKLHRT
jgi:integrase